MFADLTESFLLGFAISAVPGAVFFETIRRTIHSNTAAFSFLGGNFSGMFVIILVAFLGFSGISPDSTVATIFYAASGALLIYIGFSSVMTRKNALKKSQKLNAQAKYNAFSTGFVLAVANPLSFAFWISLSGKFFGDTSNVGSAVLNIASVVLGALLLFVVLVLSVRLIKLRIKTSHLILLSRIFGLLILGYGFITVSRVLS